MNTLHSKYNFKLLNRLFTTIFVVIISLPVLGQGEGTISLGLRGGLNTSNFAGNIGGAAGENRFKAGINFGAFGTYSIQENWGITAEVNYSPKGTVTSQFARSNIKLNYLDIPVYVNYFFGQGGDKLRTKVFLGPYIDFLMTAKQNLGGIEVDVKDRYNNLDLGLLLGAGLHYKISESGGNWLILDVRYGIGFSDIAKPGLGTSNITNRALSFNLGISFPIND
ncbi:MAG: porin family protein [Thermoflexibacter sp.]